LISGVQKEFLLELEIPPIIDKIGDNERNTVFLTATLTARSVDAEKK